MLKTNDIKKSTMRLSLIYVNYMGNKCLALNKIKCNTKLQKECILFHISFHELLSIKRINRKEYSLGALQNRRHRKISYI